MKDSAIRLAAAAAALAVMFATLTPPPAFAATEPSLPSSSDGPVYLIDGYNEVQFPKGSQLAWDHAFGVILSAIPDPYVPQDWAHMGFPATTGGAVLASTFISAQGDERTKANWKAWDESSYVGAQGALMPRLTPAEEPNGDAAAIRASGGTYSLGVAYLTLDDLTVVSAYFTTINVDAGTGTWTFATYAPPAEAGDVATTTTLVADPNTVLVGRYTTLTATVTAPGRTVTGDVYFYRGGHPIGAVALSSGVANMPVILFGATNSYWARFVATRVGSDHFLASVSASVIVNVEERLPSTPWGPSETALNASTANGATATYDAATHKATMTVNASYGGRAVNVFAYSTPAYFGVLIVDSTDATLTVDVSRLAAGLHKLAITAYLTGELIAWASFDKPDAADVSTSMTINADVAATVPADGEFSLVNLSGSMVNLTNPTLVDGASIVSGELGTFKVTDLRQVSRPGWMLMADVATFVKGTDTIGNSALGIAPKVIGQAGTGATTPTLGVPEVSGSAGYPWTIASLPTSNFSGVSTYDIDLVFTAPAAKPAGTYTSTLTLTLISQ